MTIIGQGTRTKVVEYDDTLKNHLRVFDDADQALIEHYIEAAADYIEKRIGYPYFNDEMTVITTGMNRCIELPNNTESVLSICQRDDNNKWASFTPENACMNNYGPYSKYFATNIEMGREYKIECSRLVNVTGRIKQAAYLIIGEMYEQRENRQLNANVMVRSADTLIDIEAINL